MHSYVPGKQHKIRIIPSLEHLYREYYTALRGITEDLSKQVESYTRKEKEGTLQLSDAAAKLNLIH